MNFQIDKALEILHRTPATVHNMLAGLGKEWIHSNEGIDTFSPFDAVGHLIDGEETDWMPRARIILAQGKNLRFEPYDRFRHKNRNTEKTLDSLLTDFAKLRAVNLKELESWKLTGAQLDLPGEHPGLGRVTLRQLLASWVVHDLGHIAQIARVMAKQYHDEVGPWLEYLPVLSDHPTPR